VQLLRGQARGDAVLPDAAEVGDVPADTLLIAVRHPRVARPDDVEERRGAAVVRVRRRVPDVGERRGDIFAQRAPVRRDGQDGVLEGPAVLVRYRRGVGPVEEVRRADGAPLEGVVGGRTGPFATREAGVRSLV